MGDATHEIAVIAGGRRARCSIHRKISSTHVDVSESEVVHV